MHTSSPARPGSHGRPVVVEHVDRHAEARPLAFAAPYRAGRIAADETRDDVGAARDRGELHVGLDRLVHEIETLGHERRAGREDRANRREIVRIAPGAGPPCVPSRGTSPTRRARRRPPPARGRRAPPGPGGTGIRRRARASPRSRAPTRASSTSSSRSCCSRRSCSPGRRSTCRRCSFRCCSSVPPWPCTMHFGAPVVPDE